MTPTIGRILIYVLSAADAEAINRRRTDVKSIAERLKHSVKGEFHGEIFAWPEGAQAHIGNPVKEGMEFPGIVVSVPKPMPDVAEEGRAPINLQVFLDGNDVFWATSVPEETNFSKAPKGATPGTWHWPSRG